QSHRDRRRHDGLHPDPHDAPRLLAHDRPEADEIDAPKIRVARLRAFDRDTHADLRSCLSTSRMNSSSSRFVFVRMLETCRPLADSCANTSLSPCPFATSTSISRSLRSLTV